MRIKIKLKPKPIVRIPSDTGLYKKIESGFTYTYRELSLEELREAMTELYFNRHKI